MKRTPNNALERDALKLALFRTPQFRVRALKIDSRINGLWGIITLCERS